MKPIDGKKIYNSLKDKNLAILATNIRIIPGVLEGIFQAAKELNSAVIIQAAKSECNLKDGYTRLTPAELIEQAMITSEKTKHSAWIMHADHTKQKDVNDGSTQENKELLQDCITAGYTSFAIDASYLYNSSGATQTEKLIDNIKITNELVNFIKENYHNKDFGLEVEVGEIGKKNDQGLVETEPEEALTFLDELKSNNIIPDLLAIANGTSHGNYYNHNQPVAKKINFNLTLKIINALKNAKFTTRIAQHGTTGVNLDSLVHLPKCGVLKCNVGTHWMNLVWKILEKSEPKLFRAIYDWTLSQYQDQLNNMTKQEIFDKYSKFATGEFKTELNNLDNTTINNIKEKTVLDTKQFIKILNSSDSAKLL